MSYYYCYYCYYLHFPSRPPWYPQDVNALDVSLPTMLELSLMTLSRVVVVVALACIPQPLFMVALVPLMALFYWIKELYRYLGRGGGGRRRKASFIR